MFFIIYYYIMEVYSIAMSDLLALEIWYYVGYTVQLFARKCGLHLVNDKCITIFYFESLQKLITNVCYEVTCNYDVVTLWYFADHCWIKMCCDVDVLPQCISNYWQSLTLKRCSTCRMVSARKRNSIVNTMELRLYCTNPSMCAITGSGREHAIPVNTRTIIVAPHP